MRGSAGILRNWQRQPGKIHGRNWGLSPRGTVALTAMAKACAYLKGRAYVIPADVEEVFPCVVSHRIILNMKAKVGHVKVEEVVRQILERVEKPALRTRR